MHASENIKKLVKLGKYGLLPELWNVVFSPEDYSSGKETWRYIWLEMSNSKYQELSTVNKVG